MLSPPEHEAYLCLALTAEIGPARLGALGRAFGSFQAALNAPLDVLRAVESMTPAAATAVRAADRGQVGRVLAATTRLGAVALTPFDDRYPNALRSIDDPPNVVFCQGRLDLLDQPAVAVVGTRKPSGPGIQATRELAATAAMGGLTVVSGMARGLDAVGHWAAVVHPASTIGVLGNGLGVVYPAANRGLYERVAAQGLLLTEFPPGERPNPGSFLSRNRLISGLARVTVVTEAPFKSGALDTASKANDQSREVLVIPGLITNPRAAGSNELLRDGVHPYLVPADLFSRYPGMAPPRLNPAGQPTLSPRLGLVYAELEQAPRSVDELARSLRLDSKAVAAALTELEVAGLATTEFGGGFSKVP